MKTYLVALERTEDAMDLAAALLDEGVLPEHLSLIVDESVAERTVGMEPRSYRVSIEDDLQVERSNRDFRFATTGNPEMERSFKQPLAEPPYLFESEIGGGISTSSPNDDVSGIEEMDDASSIAEESLDPFGPRDVRTHGPRSLSEIDPESEAAVSPGRSRASTSSGVYGKEEGLGVGVFAALIPAVAPGIGLVLGDGPLATDVLAGAEEPNFSLVRFLKGRGMSPPDAGRFESRLEMGGGILEVAVASGEASARQVRGCLERAGVRDPIDADAL